MAMGVVDLLEPVQVREQDGCVGVRSLGPLPGMLQPVLQHDSVREPRERIMSRIVVEAAGGLESLFASLGVEQIGGDHIRERLGRRQVGSFQGAGGVPVEVERSEPARSVAEGEREHCCQPSL
jgi:hypothetical protein